MKLDANAKLITCILPKGRAIEILEALQAKGIHRASLAFARGSDIHDPEIKRGMPQEEEKDIITIVASNPTEADEIFEFVFEKGEINRLGGGIIYMSTLGGASPYSLPEI